MSERWAEIFSLASGSLIYSHKKGGENFMSYDTGSAGEGSVCGQSLVECF